VDDQFENIMQPKMIKRKSLNDEEEEAEEYKRKKEKRKERKSKITAQC
jgi:hypothetical protein